MAIKTTSPYTDEDLTDLLKEGNRKAFDEIYNRYSKKLFLFALKKVGDKIIAEDLIQDLFISIWERKEAISIQSSLKNYLYAALRFRIINFYHSTKVYKKHNKILAELADNFTNNTQDSILYHDLENQIEAGMKKLTPKVKLVFELSRYENLSQDQIAKKLDVSKQTVKNQISIALKILKGHINFVIVFSAILFRHL